MNFVILLLYWSGSKPSNMLSTSSGLMITLNWAVLLLKYIKPCICLAAIMNRVTWREPGEESMTSCLPSGLRDSTQRPWVKWVSCWSSIGVYYNMVLNIVPVMLFVLPLFDISVQPVAVWGVCLHCSSVLYCIVLAFHLCPLQLIVATTVVNIVILRVLSVLYALDYLQTLPCCLLLKVPY